MRYMEIGVSVFIYVHLRLASQIYVSRIFLFCSTVNYGFHTEVV
jgi:hypothetical protein